MNKWTRAFSARPPRSHSFRGEHAGPELQFGEYDGGQELDELPRDNVLCDIGQPPGPHRVQVNCVWGDSYRVNVFVGLDVSSFKLAHSYFLKADRDGKILASSPAIARVC
jgi:hypothetical protein